MPIVIRDRTTLADLKQVAASRNVGIAAMIDVLVIRESSRVSGKLSTRLLAQVRRDYRRQLNDRRVSAIEKISIRKTLSQIRHLARVIA